MFSDIFNATDYSQISNQDRSPKSIQSSSTAVVSLANNSTRPPRRSWTRAVFSNLQRKGLEKRFGVQKYLNKTERRQLAAMLGLSDSQVCTSAVFWQNALSVRVLLQVKVWFQNRRMKWRHVNDSTIEGEEEKNPPLESFSNELSLL